jgi:hypothetical protein
MATGQATSNLHRQSWIDTKNVDRLDFRRVHLGPESRTALHLFVRSKFEKCIEFSDRIINHAFRYLFRSAGPRVPGVTLKSAGSNQVRPATNRAPPMRRCRQSVCTRTCDTLSRFAASAEVISLGMQSSVRYANSFSRNQQR